MEIGVRLIGIALRLLNLLLAPYFWMVSRRPRRSVSPPKGILLKSVMELIAGIKTGELTSEQIVTTFIKRVIEVNPLINAVVEDRFAAAIEDAKSADKTIAEAKRKGTFNELTKAKPLIGVPFTVKESCSLAGFSNSVGCIDHAGRKATKDGPAISNLKMAGAIPLLISNTPELCLGWETTNQMRGTTNNPYDLARTPGGSSGGEAALLCSGASPFGVGSDIAGSLRLPAAFCGLFGHKPTPGIISIDEHVPYVNDEKYSKYLTVGPMARRAEDLKLLLNIMAGDNKDKLDLDRPVDIKDVKVFYMTEGGYSMALIDVEKYIKDAITAAANYLHKECGAELSEEKFEEFEESVEISISNFFSMKDIPNIMHNPANPKRDRSMLVELVKYLFGHGARSLQALGFALIAKTQLFVPTSRTQYYQDKADALKQRLVESLGSSGVLLFPAFPARAHHHGGLFGRAAGVAYVMPANVLALPAVAVPLAPQAHLPLGIQVIAAPYQDRLCLEVARQLEKGFGGWQPPH